MAVSRDSSVDITSDYGLDGRGVGVPVGARFFSLHVVQTSFGAHRAS
jgi:hypothetical protein